MKIAILTQPLHNNYGGILQNYALQTYFRKMGHSATTINFKHRPLNLNPTSFIVEYAKNITKRLLGKKVLCINPYKNDYKIFSSTAEKGRFIEQYIQKVDVDAPLTKEWAAKQDYDAYCVGSDQIWRPKYSPSIANFFLDFTSDSDAKRIAYAASFGVDCWEFSDTLTQTAKECLNRFDGVSVREESGVCLCKQYLDTKAIHLIDPTLLLDADEYRALFPDKQWHDDSEYILCYTLDYSTKIQDIISHLPAKYQAKVIFVNGENIGKEDISVERWLQLISGAKYVVTDSFHGTVFSILFHRPFYSVINDVRGAERVRSLLSMFELAQEQDEYDWQSVENKLADYRVNAADFIVKSLS